MSPEATAWLAGLIEGEGCLDAAQGRWPRIRIVMKDRDVLVRIQQVAGGTLNRENKRNGKPQWSQYYVWRLSRKDKVEPVLKAILPWLSERRTIKALELLGKYE